MALCFYLLTYCRLLAARAVGAAAAGGVAVRRRIAAAVTVVVGHVFGPFYFGGWRVSFKKRGYFVAPRGKPGAITRGYASTRRCSDCTGWRGCRRQGRCTYSGAFLCSGVWD